MLTNMLIIGIGGFSGAIMRYLLLLLVQNFEGDSAFPCGTITVNIAGCYLVGILSQIAYWLPDLTSEIKLFLMIGFIGSFTTYSTFTNETLILFDQKRYLLAGLNVSSHFLLGILALVLGRMTISQFLK